MDEWELFWEVEHDEECEECHRLELVADADTIDNRASFLDSILTLVPTSSSSVHASSGSGSGCLGGGTCL